MSFLWSDTHSSTLFFFNEIFQVKESLKKFFYVYTHRFCENNSFTHSLLTVSYFQNFTITNNAALSTLTHITPTSSNKYSGLIPQTRSPSFQELCLHVSPQWLPSPSIKALITIYVFIRSPSKGTEAMSPLLSSTQCLEHPSRLTAVLS